MTCNMSSDVPGSRQLIGSGPQSVQRALYGLHCGPSFHQAVDRGDGALNGHRKAAEPGPNRRANFEPLA